MSLEDLYKDLAISNEDGVLNNVPVPIFRFPELPDAFTTDDDKENWNTLGDALNKSNGHVATLDGVVKNLVSADERFRYIRESVTWLKFELERMCEMPPLAAENSNGSSQSEESEGAESSSEPDIDLEPAMNENSNISEADAPEADGSSISDQSSIAEGMFQPSDMYDWSEIEDDVHLMQEVTLMNPLMAIYEILDTGTISEADLNNLFSQPMLADWDGTMQETLLDVLKFLSEMFLERHQLKHLDSPEIHENDGKEAKDVSAKQPVIDYPSPKMIDAHEIRVLELLPGSEEQPIHCLLSIEHLWDDPRYEALSYAWGSSVETKPIQLNKTSFEITPNLEVALRHLRYEQDSRRLWVDALCINQNDPIEKQTQVKLMCEIYPAADKVLCWLGPEGDDSAFVMQRLQEIADAKTERRGSFSSDDTDMESEPDVDPHYEDKERFYNGLFKLFSRQWWSRLWTCQEFALTLRDPEVICGKQRSKFHFPASNALDRWDGTLPPVGSDLTITSQTTYWETVEIVYGCMMACELRTKRGFAGLHRTTDSHPIFAMAIWIRRYRCTDPRDKLFGILSFLLEPHRALFPPNYTQSTAQVYVKYSAAILMVSGCGQIYNRLSPRSTFEESIPSWAIDFSSQTADGEFDPGMLSKRSKDKDRICTSKGRKTECITVGPRLIIRGVILDEIQTAVEVQTGELLKPAQMHASLTAFHRNAMERSREVNIHDHSPASKFQHLRTVDSVYKIITCGTWNDEEFHQVFERWVPAEDLKASETEVTVISNQAATGSETLSSSSSFISNSSDMSDSVIQLVLYSMASRRLIITRSGFFGIGVSGIQEGDLVVILFGFDVPMILRRAGEHFTLIGAARIGGVMEGELMEFVDNGILEERSFVIL
ncbi:hypothetical protein IFR05_008795 [Cadophora sp. M221]|nr:hypothetical protein IFR05_008795 [Cadophora sp. M221]